jgi:hypothetical protein
MHPSAAKFLLLLVAAASIELLVGGIAWTATAAAQAERELRAAREGRVAGLQGKHHQRL